MSPINIMYLILGITAVLLFVIFKYVKDPEEEKERRMSAAANIETYPIDNLPKRNVDFREFKMEGGKQKLTQEELDAFVEKYALNLPKLYLDFMLYTNGGIPDSYFGDEKDIRFSPIKYGVYTIDDCLGVSDDFFLPHYFPFIDNGEYGFCFSMNDATLHQVFHWDETGDFWFAYASFQDFLNEFEAEDAV